MDCSTNRVCCKCHRPWIVSNQEAANAPARRWVCRSCKAKARMKTSLIGRIKIVAAWWEMEPGPLTRLCKRVEKARPSYYTGKVVLLDGKPFAVIAQAWNSGFRNRMLLSVRAPHQRLLKRVVPHWKLRRHIFALAKALEAK